MAQLKAVLFDVDGTLAETERHGHLVAFNKTFEKFGLDWHWSAELYGELLAVTGSTERLYHFVKTHKPAYEHINPDLDALIRDMIVYKNDAYVEIANQGIPLRIGVERLFREIHASDVLMGIATTTGHQNVRSLLVTNLGEEALDWFAVIAAGNDVPQKKPAPDVYHLAMEKLGLRPEECLAVEDSENGVRSAVDAGIPVLAVLAEYSGGHDLSGARMIVDQLGDEDHPAHALQGDMGGRQMVDLTLLKELVA